MNRRLFTKLVIDFLMFIIFIWLMLSPATTHYIHEILGVIFIVLLVIHTISNRRWYQYLFKGKYHLVRLLQTMINLSLAALIFINIISALGISLWLFVFLPIDWGMTGRELHILSAYWGMILLSIHIGFHWDMLMNMTRNALHFSQKNQLRLFILRLFTAMTVVYGFYAAIKLDIGSRLVAYYSFSFFDPEQSYWVGFVDYLTFCGACIAMTHYGLKLLRQIKKH